MYIGVFDRLLGIESKESDEPEVLQCQEINPQSVLARFNLEYVA